MKAAFVGNVEQIQRVWGSDRIARVASMTQLHEVVIASSELDQHLPELNETDVLLSTWGMPELNEAQLDALPNLKLVLYAAGDVRGFAGPLLKRGVKIVSAWRANALPVAEFTLAQILLAGKSYSRNVAHYHANRTPKGAPVGPGNSGETVALLGAGAIGRILITLLKPFDLRVLVFDPFLSPEDAEALGVEKVELGEAFERGMVVSNHLINNPETVGLITECLLRTMRDGATFINTGRGATVEQAGFVRAMGARPDLTALLDVTDPSEPLPSDSPIWGLPNVFVSTHIAGSIGNEVGRMADLCISELERYLLGEPLKHLV